MKIRLYLNSDNLLTTNLKNIYPRFFNHLDIYIQMNVVLKSNVPENV